jgi:hypothetical protein
LGLGGKISLKLMYDFIFLFPDSQSESKILLEMSRRRKCQWSSIILMFTSTAYSTLTFLPWMWATGRNQPTYQ